MFTHILPPTYRRRLLAEFASYHDEPWAAFYSAALAQDPGLWELETRLAEMADVGADYRQVISLSAPGIEEFAAPQLGAELAHIANDEMADLVAANPDRFVGFAAQLPMNDIDLALCELEYAVEQRGALGIQLGSNILKRPIDHPEFEPVIAKIAELDRAIWLHPARDLNTPDYAGEDTSQYILFVSLGWPYDTSLAMARLVYSGTMERYPALKVIAHHGGGMVPYFFGRLASVAALAGSNRSLTLPPLDYFRRFYVDTVMDGNRSALRACLDFFGADHLLFGTDYGFKHDPRSDSADIDALALSADDRALIFENNARRILVLQNA